MQYPPTSNVEQAAELLHVHPKTVSKMIHTGELPAAKVGRSYVMLTRDLIDYVSNQINQQTTERMRSTTSV